jgi:AbrB family looped-hinge helix DNA binding protein
MNVTSKGQVTIPIAMREQLGILPNTRVEFRLRGQEIVLRKVESDRRRGREIVGRLRGKGSSKLSTDEILRLTRGD